MTLGGSWCRWLWTVQYGITQYAYQYYPRLLPDYGFGPGERVDTSLPWQTTVTSFSDLRALVRRQEVANPNDLILQSTYQYNGRGLLRSLVNNWIPGGLSLSAFLNVGYDASGNRAHIGSMRIERIGSAKGMLGSLTYVVDPSTHRSLIEESFNRIDYDISSYRSLFAYDASDNLTTIRGVSDITYNANNQIVRSGFQYDTNGNPTLFAGNSLSYDYENRVLIANSLSMAYRPDGKRAWKQPGGVDTRVYYVYDGERVLFEFNPVNGFSQAYGYGANGLATSLRQSEVRIYAFDPAGNLVHRLTPTAVLSNSGIDSYGSIVYDDSVTGVTPFPSPDSVAYQGQWGAYTDIENWGWHLRGDYYSASWCRWLTRQSAGGNEYSAGVNPADHWVDSLQDLLSLAGIADPTGFVDLVNAVGYALRGKWIEAAIAGASVWPGGDVAKIAKWSNIATRGGLRLAGRGSKAAAKEASEEWVKLYRAVSLGEVEDIMQTGKLRVKFGQMEGKWFTTTPELAARWGKKMYKKQPYSIIEVAVPKSLLRSMHFDDWLDAIGPAYFAEPPALPHIRFLQELPFIPYLP